MEIRHCCLVRMEVEGCILKTFVGRVGGRVGNDFHSSHPYLGSGLSVGSGHLRSVEKKELVGLEYK